MLATKRSNLLLPILLLLAAMTNSSHASALIGETRMHDPSRIVRCEGKYYVYGTGRNVISRVSTDLIHWQEGPRVLNGVPQWARQAVPKADSDHVWAPDVLFFQNRYLLFYSFSTFGSPVSVIGLVSSPTLDSSRPDYKWSDQGLVIASDQKSGFNAIDPCPLLDEKGDLWMAFGSWQRNGIQVVRLDNTTIKPIGEPATLARGQASGPEAAYVHWRDGFYYLWENEGACCRGMNSTYDIRVGRARTITGPYLDREGRDLRQGGGTLFLGSDGARIGPGHVGIWQEDGPSGLDFFTFHFYNGEANGTPTLGLQTLVWGEDGWPRPGVELSPGHYAIISSAGNFALRGGKGDGAPITATAASEPLPAWNLSPTGDGYWSIGPLGSGKFLDLSDCKTEDGTPIAQQPWLNNDCQRWKIEAVGVDTFRIVAKGGPVVTLPETGGAVRAEAWNGRPGQVWLFRKLP